MLATCWLVPHSIIQEVPLRIDVKVPQVYDIEKEYSRMNITLIKVSLYQIFPAMELLTENQGRNPSLRKK